MILNDFFRVNDYHSREFYGHTLPETWWSRHYEYPWAILSALDGKYKTAADMGCGYIYRPFKDIVAALCKTVYAVDSNSRLLEQAPFPKNIVPVISPLQKIELVDESLDLVFCISVLEETNCQSEILKEFHRVMKPDGQLVLTFDVPYDPAIPLGRYKGLDLNTFWKMADAAGFDTPDAKGTDKTDALFHEEFNLCVYHAILVKK